DGVEVPAEHVLGGETGGVEKIGTILSEIRVMTAALSVGLARAAYQAALTYARERQAFGKPIVEHQAITFKLADMVTSLHVATVPSAPRPRSGSPARARSWSSTTSSPPTSIGWPRRSPKWKAARASSRWATSRARRTWTAWSGKRSTPSGGSTSS